MILGMEGGRVEGRGKNDRPRLASNVIWFVAWPLCMRVSKPLHYRKTLTERDSFFLPHYQFVRKILQTFKC